MPRPPAAIATASAPPVATGTPTAWAVDGYPLRVRLSSGRTVYLTASLNATALPSPRHYAATTAILDASAEVKTTAGNDGRTTTVDELAADLRRSWWAYRLAVALFVLSACGLVIVLGYGVASPAWLGLPVLPLILQATLLVGIGAAIGYSRRFRKIAATARGLRA